MQECFSIMKFSEVFSDAKWVACSEFCVSPYIRAFFDTECLSASINVCGLGFSEVYINGHRVGNELFTPLTSCYHTNPKMQCVIDCGEELGSRTYVVKEDISTYLKKGRNIIVLQLAPGWYAHRLEDECEWVKPYGPVKAAWRISFADGTECVSGEDAQWRQSPIVKYDILCREIQDDAYCVPDFEADDGKWKPVQITDMPETEYCYQDTPSDTVVKTVVPKKIYAGAERSVYDAGENITGRVVFRVNGRCHVKVLYGEAADSENRLDMRYYHWQESEHECFGNREYGLRFTWFGFRYFDIDNTAEVLRVEVIHTDAKVKADFKSSSPVLDWYHDAFVRTQLNNMHSGIPSDCPQLERRGYTGDGELTCEAVMTVLDCKSFYRKWMRDISDCQDRKSGHVQYTAPYIVSGGGPGGWGCAIIEVPYVYWKQYDDIEPLREMYPQTLKYFGYLDAHSENGLVVSDQPGAWCLGEWAVPENGVCDDRVKIPSPYVNTYFYIRSINRAIEVAPLLGREEDIKMLSEKKKMLEKAIVEEYYDKSSGNFAGNVLFGNCYAVDLGLGEERTWENLCSDVEAKGYFDTGIFGADITLRLLFSKGRADLAYKLMTSRKKYSFGYWMDNGMTTLCEHWNCERSLDHPMFGSSARYLYRYILGIGQTENSRAYSEIEIAPACIPELEHASGYVDTPAGRISVSRKTEGSKTVFEIETPTDAKFVYDGNSRLLAHGKNIIEI